ncbi:barstar family protein [Agromyces aerolatus]|uniref:barstar family protein n=1 Tax=Agromyces sp. LY-1074 TaxID=3074080 RepID=UPI0037BEEA9E
MIPCCNSNAQGVSFAELLLGLAASFRASGRHRASASALAFPECCGANLDALADCLSVS